MDERFEHRDEQLGGALRELDVPAHAPGFDDELRRLLAAESRAPGKRSRPLSVRWALPAAAAAAAVALAVVAIGVPRTDRTPSVGGPEPATAAAIKQRVRASLAELRTLSGVLVHDGPQAGDERRWRFALTADGDFRLEGPSPGEVIGYDASSGVARSAQRSASAGGDTLFHAERRGIAPGPPDGGPPGWLLPDELGAFVRALLAADDPRVAAVRYEGRPAWRLDVETVPNAIVPDFTGDRFEITVDRATGVPVRVVETNGRRFVREIRVERVVVDAPLPASTFDVAFPADVEVLRSDDGFRRVPLEDVAGAVGYAPLLPAWVPDGFELAEVAVAGEAGPTGVEAGNPRSRGVVSLSYRRGLDQFLVTTRVAGDASRWSDPLATGEGFVDEPETVAVRGGALDGSRAKLLIAPRAIPHLWAVGRGLVVTVGGDLGRAEILRIAASLVQ